jgi:hypothetical protein
VTDYDKALRTVAAVVGDVAAEQFQCNHWAVADALRTIYLRLWAEIPRTTEANMNAMLSIKLDVLRENVTSLIADHQRAADDLRDILARYDTSVRTRTASPIECAEWLADETITAHEVASGNADKDARRIATKIIEAERAHRDEQKATV